MGKPFIKYISPKNSKPGSTNEQIGINQSSPAWVLTFVRWSNRFPYDYKTITPLDTRKPMVVINDCVSLTISSSKASHTPSLVATLMSGDINYIAAIAPGDFVFANILDWPSQAVNVHDRASAGAAINKQGDGFKGVFKIQSVRRILSVDPASGLKRMAVQVQAYAFTEFNNTIYFNPFLLTPGEKNNDFLFITRISSVWEQQVGKENINNIQQIIKLLIDSLIGSGIGDDGRKVKGVDRSVNVHFFIPPLVGSLLGIPNAKSAKDMYRYLFGVQTYSGSANGSLAAGLNPDGLTSDGPYSFTKTPCSGNAYLQAEYWNQVTAWSILNQFTNAPINEFFTSFKTSPSGKVMPTVVFRQIPFSSEKYKGEGTRFLNLPRWHISPDLIYEANMGREEAARINFVQVFGRNNQLSSEAQQASISDQIGRVNYRYDLEDIKRSGLQPYIVTSNFDAVVSDKQTTLTTGWVELLADSLIGGHLKTNGSIECVGIVDPISIGDNLEMDGTVYHIESITHSASVNPNGVKSFRTHIDLSHGVDIRSNADNIIFPQMDNINRELESQLDWDRKARTIPGYTDEQDIPGRKGSFGKDTTKNGGFNPPKTQKKPAERKPPKKSK